MEYIDFEAEDENANDDNELVFSDEDDENVIHLYRFLKQTRDLVEAVNYDDGSKLDKYDLQPEILYCIKREHGQKILMDMKL